MWVIQYFLSIKFFQGFISCFLSLFKSFLLKLYFISLIHSCSIYNRLLLFINLLFFFFQIIILFDWICKSSLFILFLFHHFKNVRFTKHILNSFSKIDILFIIHS